MKKTALFSILLLSVLFIFSCTKIQDDLSPKDTENQNIENSFEENLEDVDRELEEHFAEMAPDEPFPQYFADERFSIYYPPVFKEDDSAKSEDDVKIFRSFDPDKEAILTVSANEINISYEQYKENLLEKYPGIVLHEYGDESLTGVRPSGGENIPDVYLYLAFDSGKIYFVERILFLDKENILPSGELQFVVWWE